MAEQIVEHGSGAGGIGPVDVFLKSGPGQTAVMATVVTFAGQAAAQLGLAPPGPTLAAIAFALLVAVYNVRTVQRVQGLNCFVLVPIVALVAFTSGWGANGLIGAAGSGGKASQGDLAPLVAALRQETANLEQRLKLQADELAILRKLSGVGAEGVPGPSGYLQEGRWWKIASETLLDVLASPVYAQSTAPPLTPTERAKLLQDLRGYEAKQKALAVEAERVRKDREEAEKQTQQIQQAPGGLWKKW